MIIEDWDVETPSEVTTADDICSQIGSQFGDHSELTGETHFTIGQSDDESKSEKCESFNGEATLVADDSEKLQGQQIGTHSSTENLVRSTSPQFVSGKRVVSVGELNIQTYNENGVVSETVVTEVITAEEAVLSEKEILANLESENVTGTSPSISKEIYSENERVDDSKDGGMDSFYYDCIDSDAVGSEVTVDSESDSGELNIIKGVTNLVAGEYETNDQIPTSTLVTAEEPSGSENGPHTSTASTDISETRNDSDKPWIVVKGEEMLSKVETLLSCNEDTQISVSDMLTVEDRSRFESQHSVEPRSPNNALLTPSCPILVTVNSPNVTASDNENDDHDVIGTPFVTKICNSNSLEISATTRFESQFSVAPHSPGNVVLTPNCPVPVHVVGPTPSVDSTPLDERVSKHLEIGNRRTFESQHSFAPQSPGNVILTPSCPIPVQIVEPTPEENLKTENELDSNERPTFVSQHSIALHEESVSTDHKVLSPVSVLITEPASDLGSESVEELDKHLNVGERTKFESQNSVAPKSPGNVAMTPSCPVSVNVIEPTPIHSTISNENLSELLVVGERAKFESQHSFAPHSPGNVILTPSCPIPVEISEPTPIDKEKSNTLPNLTLVGTPLSSKVVSVEYEEDTLSVGSRINLETQHSIAPQSPGGILLTPSCPISVNIIEPTPAESKPVVKIEPTTPVLSQSDLKGSSDNMISFISPKSNDSAKVQGSSPRSGGTSDTEIDIPPLSSSGGSSPNDLTMALESSGSNDDAFCYSEITCSAVEKLPHFDFNELVGLKTSYDITHVESPNLIYVKISNDPRYASLHSNLAVYLSNYEKESDFIKGARVNKPVIVAVKVKSQWQRGILLSSIMSTEPLGATELVQLIDSGETISVETEKIKQLKKHWKGVADLPAQTVLIRISNAQEMISPILREMVGQSIVLKFEGANVTAATGLAECVACCCDPILCPDQGAHIRSLPKYREKLAGSKRRVIVTHYSTLLTDFFVQLLSDINIVEEIVEVLNLASTNPDGSLSLPQLTDVQVGQVCASIFAESDEMALYRCQVVSCNPLTVYFVDYGNTEVVSRVYHLPDIPILWSPPCAHRCRLSPNSESFTQRPIEVHQILNEPEAEVDLMFVNAIDDGEEPQCYDCEVILSTTEESNADSLPCYPRLVDGVCIPTALSQSEQIIWLQMEERDVELLKLETDLSEFFDSNNLQKVQHPSPGKICIAVSPTSETPVYRAEVKMVDQGSISLLQVDYGREETFNSEDLANNFIQLYEIPSSLTRRVLEPCRFAIPCKLQAGPDAYRKLRLNDFPHVTYFVHFLPNSTSAPFAVDMRALEDRASTTTPGFRGSVSIMNKPTVFSFPSVTTPTETTANTQFFGDSASKPESGFVDNVFDDSDKDSPAPKRSEMLFQPAFQNGQTFRGICVLLNAKDIDNDVDAFFHDEGRSAELETLCNALHDVSRFSPINFSDMTVGQMVAARYATDSLWYRAIILSKPLNKEHGPTVFFVDYGNSEKLASSSPIDILQLPPSLSPARIKPLAIPVRLRSSDRNNLKMLEEAHEFTVLSTESTTLDAAGRCRIPVLGVAVALEEQMMKKLALPDDKKGLLKIFSFSIFIK